MPRKTSLAACIKRLKKNTSPSTWPGKSSDITTNLTSPENNRPQTVRSIIRVISLLGASLLAAWLYCGASLAQSNSKLPELGDSSALVLSPAQEKALGKLYFNSIAAHMPLIGDPLSLAYINTLGARLSNYAQNHGLKFHFFIVDDSSINAFAGPGGYIGVNRGLILHTDNESELAAVMAHEIAHVTQRHIARGMAHAKAMRLPMLAGALAAIALGVSGQGNAANASMVSAMSLSANSMLSFTQGEEKEADQVGIRTLYKAGFNPQAMPNFFKKMQAINQDYENHQYNFTDHPLISERLAESENRISHLHLKPHVASTADYYLFKARLKNLSRKAPKGEKPQWLLNAENRSMQLKYTYQYHANKKTYAKDYGYALALLKNKQTKPAEIIISHLKNRQQENIWADLLQANLLATTGRQFAAQHKLNALYQLYPDYKPITISLVHTLIKDKKIKTAADILQQQIINHPEQTIWYIMLAKCYAEQKQFSDATIYQSKAYLQRAMPQIAYIQLQQLQKNKSLSGMQRQEIYGLMARAQEQIQYLEAMIPGGMRK